MTRVSPTSPPTELQDLVEELDSGLEIFSHHAPTSDEFRRAFARVGLALASAFELRGSFTLSVTGSDFHFEGDTVPRRDGVPGSLAPALWLGGIRSVTFAPGAERLEAVRFLTAVQSACSLEADDADDLQTLLWDLDLESIRYTVEEADVGPAAPEAKAAAPSGRGASQEVRAQVRQEAQAAQQRKGVVDVEDFDSTLYFLDPREVAHLREGVQREYAQDLGKNVASLLLDIWETQAQPEIRTEVLQLLQRLLPHLLSQGAFTAAAYLLAEARTAARRAPQVTGGERRALDRLVETLSGPDALAQLLHFLEDAETPPPGEELGALLAHLRPQALPTLLRWVGRLTNPKATPVLAKAVVCMVREQPVALSAALRCPDGPVLLRALALVRRLAVKARAEDVCALRSHADANVRVAVADTLATLGGGRCCGQLVHMIDDPDVEVRIRTLRALIARRYAKAVPRIRAHLEDTELLDRDLVEQRTIFEAYGSLAGAPGVHHLEPIIFGKKGPGRRSPDVRACAALALGKIGTPAARQLLQRAERDRSPVVRSAVSSALGRR